MHVENSGLVEAGYGKKVRAKMDGNESGRSGGFKGRGRLVASDLFQLYINDIQHIPVLSREKEKELAIRYFENGDINSGRKLVTSNLRLVVKLAMELERYWMQNLMDLIQEGNIGLIQALDKFDPYRGYRFSYYASFWIKAYILKFIMDNWKLVKIGTTQAQRKLFFGLYKEKEKLEALGITASPRLLSQRLNVKESEVLAMGQRLYSGEVSLESSLNDNTRDTYKDLLTSDEYSVDNRMAVKEARTIIHDELMFFRNQLNMREAFIFDNRLLAEQPMTLQEIGEIFDISRERARQLDGRIRRKLRDLLKHDVKDIDLIQEVMNGD